MIEKNNVEEIGQSNRQKRCFQLSTTCGIAIGVFLTTTLFICIVLMLIEAFKRF